MRSASGAADSRQINGAGPWITTYEEPADAPAPPGQRTTEATAGPRSANGRDASLRSM